MTQIAFLGREDEQGFTLYDATMGSGSLLLNAKKFSHQPQTVQYFGQELNTSTYNLAPDEHDPTRGPGGKPVLA